MFIESFLIFSLLNPPASIEPAQKAATAVVQQQVTADQVVGRVQTFYKGNAQLSAKFRQVYTNATFGKKSISDGKVWLKKAGGKMRWDYYKKTRKGAKATVGKSFLSDGETLWAVEHGNKQYFKRSLKDAVLPVAVTFLTGQGNLSKDFRAALDKSGKYGSKRDYVLKLTPRKPSAQYKNLWLVVSPDNYRVTQSIVLEASGNTNHFRFYNPNFTRPVLDKWFVLNEGELKKKRYRLVEGKKKK
ncbi:MAG: outer membrane lipoprotein carrier protein LolA [Deltaproteobacteria bacterium]|nr:outer membrane lipoprotein carrier protein LolA [Deltaproteobacteria bacterium]